MHRWLLGSRSQGPHRGRAEARPLQGPSPPTPPNFMRSLRPARFLLTSLQPPGGGPLPQVGCEAFRKSLETWGQRQLTGQSLSTSKGPQRELDHSSGGRPLSPWGCIEVGSGPLPTPSNQNKTCLEPRRSPDLERINHRSKVKWAAPRTLPDPPQGPDRHGQYPHDLYADAHPCPITTPCPSSNRHLTRISNCSRCSLVNMKQKPFIKCC